MTLANIDFSLLSTRRVISFFTLGLALLLAGACGASPPPTAVAESTPTQVSAVAPYPAPATGTMVPRPAAVPGQDAVLAVSGLVSATLAPEPSSTSAAVLSAAPEMASSLPLSRTTNILVLGSDRRPDAPNWRTDVIIIVAMDLERGRAGLISIPRDVFVEPIPNHQPNRINVIDYLGEQDQPEGGGPALFGSIIAERMGIPIHHFVRFEFESFRDVVNILGGVEVEVDCPFAGYIEDEGGWLVLDPGAHRLDGNQAMIYVRSRQNGGDLDRARRQQRFLWAVRNQALSENLIVRGPALYSALADSIETDLGLIQTLRLARFALDLNPNQIHGMVLGPPDMLEAGWRQGMFVFVPSWEVIAHEVQSVFDRVPFFETNTLGLAGDAVHCP